MSLAGWFGIWRRPDRYCHSTTTSKPLLPFGTAFNVAEWQASSSAFSASNWKGANWPNISEVIINRVALNISSGIGLNIDKKKAGKAPTSKTLSLNAASKE